MKKTLNPFDLIDYYAKTMFGRPKTAHYASQIISCPRANWFAFKGVTPSNPVNVSSFFKMEVGSAIGEIKTRAMDAALKMWYAKHPEVLFWPLMEILEGDCPQMVQDIKEASEREERAFDLSTITPYTIPEVPFREYIPGLEYPLSGRVDSVANMPYFEDNGRLALDTVALMMEDKSSSAASTRMVKEKGDTWITYQLQHFAYHHRYPELITEMDYVDREWGYPYRFGMETLDSGVTVFQPGGPGRMGTPLASKLPMSPWQFIVARLRWMEELMKSDTPPGRHVMTTIKAPHSRGDFKEFTEIKLELPGHPTFMADRDKYLLYVNSDGSMIPNRGQTAEGIHYRANTCGTFCNFRDHCMKLDGVTLRD